MTPQPLVSLRRRAAAVAAAAAGLAVLAAPGLAARYAQGEEVEVAGVVSDASGAPIPGLEVLLTGHRESFDVWSFKRGRRGESSISALTDERGAFRLVWRWDRFYNRFRLRAGIRARQGGEERWWQVAELELTRAMRRGSPVVANLQVDDAGEVRSLQAFVDSLDGEDAQRVYQALGRPEEVRTTALPTGLEVTWWYFERGMLYRFLDGRLDSSESFEPVGPTN